MAGTRKARPNAADRSVHKAAARVASEAAGVATIHLVRPGPVLNLMAMARAGDQAADTILNVALLTRERIATARPNAPMRCGCCEAPVRDTGMTLAVVTGRRDDPKSAMALAICPECDGEPQEIAGRALTALRRIWPGLREIAIHEQEGQA